MKKNIKRLALLFVAAATMFAVACSKEDNQTNTSNNSESTFTMAKADVTYEISLQSNSVEALTKAYDVFIDFYDADGKIQNSSEITASNLSWSKSLTITKFPACYGAQFRLVPKSDLNGVTEGDSFSCSGTLKVYGTGTSTTGKTRPVGNDTQTIAHSGINPHEGRTFSKSCRYYVQTDGSYERNMAWE